MEQFAVLLGDRIPAPGGNSFLRIYEIWYTSDRMLLRDGADVLIKLDRLVAVQSTFIFALLSRLTKPIEMCTLVGFYTAQNCQAVLDR